jgi:hypothetical protein
MEAHADDPLTISGRRILHAEEVAALGHALEALPERVMQDRRVPLGTYRGLRFGMVLHPQWTPAVYLEGQIIRQDTLSREHQGPRAVLNAVERMAKGYGIEAERTRQDLGIAQSQLRDYQARIGQPLQHADYLTQLTTLRDRLKAGLSGAAPQDGELTVFELAERLKALRAANAIEATPERPGKRSASAEEPITARIRRRVEAPAAAEISHLERRAKTHPWTARVHQQDVPAEAEGRSR